MLPQTPYFCCCKISKYFPPHDLNQKMRNVERIINKKLNIPIHVRGGLANTEQGLTHAGKLILEVLNSKQFGLQE